MRAELGAGGLPALPAMAEYFVLRYFEALEQRPPLGTLALQCSEWWIDHPFIPGLLAEHFTTRAEKGDKPTFGDGLGAISICSPRPGRPPPRRSEAEIRLGTDGASLPWLLIKLLNKSREEIDHDREGPSDIRRENVRTRHRSRDRREDDVGR
jgi:hypothetical protein